MESNEKFLEDLNKLIKERAEKTGKSLGFYYRMIINYCKQRTGDK